MARAGSRGDKKTKKQHGATASLKDTASAKRLAKAATVSPVASLRLDAARRPLKPAYLHEDLIYAIPSFLSKSECERVIKFAEGQSFARVTQRATKLYAFRDNDRILLRMPEFAELLWQRMKPLVPAEYEGMYAAGLNPAIRFYRYSKGQRFGCHVDQSDVDAETGYHSRFTVLVYLNDASDSALVGGETIFYGNEAGAKEQTVVLSVSPATGSALVHGHGDRCLLHEGALVKEGAKYLLRTDGYELQEFLGEGSSAQVYLAATRSEPPQRVAIKVLDKLLVQHAQLERTVRREFLLHAQLHHDHVVRVVEVLEDERNNYLVMELCEQGSVAQLLRSHRAATGEDAVGLDEASAKRIFHQTVLGVEYLHANGLIHRDLKLSNLLLTADGDVKISDFGLATRVADEPETICGTPNFIAPEVLAAEGSTAAYGQAADIWSLGCVLHALLLGQPPFQGRRVSDTLANVVNAHAHSLSFPQGFSAAAADLIKRMLNPSSGNDVGESEELDEADSSISSDDALDPEIDVSLDDAEAPGGAIPGAESESLARPTTTNDGVQPSQPAAVADNREVCSLSLRLRVSDLPFLGVSAEACDVTWNCWESQAFHQLRRFTLQVSNGFDAEYELSTGRLRATRRDRVVSFEKRYSTVAPSTAIRDGGDEALLQMHSAERYQIERFCQCLAARALQLRRASLANGVTERPVVHFDTLPESLLITLRREPLQSTLEARLTLGVAAAAAVEEDASDSATCVVPGVGEGRLDDRGCLTITFTDKSVVVLSASGSTLRFRRSPQDPDDEFDLLTSTLLPTVVKQRLEHVPTFVRRLQVPASSRSTR
ncbi:hypothetical protein ATCC90586_009410 [Pythium insidiosum]|nr:hypothetical protein ATCC90586_009410 [Pythium insidiosum]